MGTLHFALGATGIAGAWLGVPEGVLAIGWLVVFLAYFRLTARPWRFVPLHTRGPIVFRSASGKLDLARALGITGVLETRVGGDGMSTYTIDLSPSR